ncbi:MAG: hypothetical protein RhofKO_29360 [Rhodothermales bacterium]
MKQAPRLEVVHQVLKRVACEAQSPMDRELAAVSGNPVAGSGLDQAGLQDGQSIIRDFLEHNELGLAFDHVIYMIEEAELALSNRAREELRYIKEVFGQDES